MKVTINPLTGEVSFDLDLTVDEALSIARQIKVETQPEAAPDAPASESPPLCRETATAELTNDQYMTWQYLVDNENAVNGVTVAAVARHLRLNRGAANHRLVTLVKLGFAERISRGRYRAACGKEG